ncbi:hypothetical protein M413DRAFT_440716, partial [Hebeloma cylindrosporum]
MPHVPDASSDDGLFDPAQFQHLVDHGHENPMAISSNSESSSDSEFHVGGSDSNESEDESEDGTDALDAHVRESIQEDDNELDSESDSSEIGISGDTTPLAKYSRARPARPSVSSLSISSFSTPITQQSHVATPPCHFTRSQRKQDQALLSRNPPSSSGPHLDDRDRLIRKLRKELEHTHAQRDSAETHAVQAQRQCAVWKHRFNKKQEKARKETRRIYTRARVVSNDAGLEDAQQDHDKRAEKQQKEAAKIAQKAAKQKEDLVRRATQGSTRAFAGSLSLSRTRLNLKTLQTPLGSTFREQRLSFLSASPAILTTTPASKKMHASVACLTELVAASALPRTMKMRPQHLAQPRAAVSHLLPTWELSRIHMRPLTLLLIIFLCCLFLSLLQVRSPLRTFLQI